MNRCPTREILERYAGDMLDEGVAGEIEDHAATCRWCAKTLSRLDVNEDLVRELRESEESVRENDAIVSTVAKTLSTVLRTRLSRLIE